MSSRKRNKSDRYFSIQASFYFELLLTIQKIHESQNSKSKIDIMKSIKCVGSAIFDKKIHNYHAKTSELQELLNLYLKYSSNLNPTQTLITNLKTYNHSDKCTLFPQDDEQFKHEARIHKNQIKWYLIHLNKGKSFSQKKVNKKISITGKKR